MPHAVRAAVALLAVSATCLASAGCRAELGECDPAEATQVVFYDSGNLASGSNGVPMYAGQAITHLSCGNGQFCHSEDASIRERYGVPAGLFFDMQHACDEGPCDLGEEGIARLAQNQANVLAHARQVLTTVKNGRMPPGQIGREIVSRAGDFRMVDVVRAQAFTLYSEVLPCSHPLADCGAGETSQEIETPRLPDVGSRQGQEILRNWVACGAPVIESTVGDVASAPGSSCSTGSGVGHAGDCIYRIVQPPEPPDQNWTSIYEGVIRPLCGETCHGDGTPNFIAESQLDLSSQDLAYDSIVGVVAAGEACDGLGELVAPGDSLNSIFTNKLEREPVCGDPMPSRGAVLPAEVVDVIRAWIDDGAPND